MSLLEDYRKFTHSTAIYPAESWREYVMHGLVSEVGEVAGKIKKFIRDKTSEEQLKEDVKKEIGDILWYVDRLAHHFGLGLEEIIQANVAKLQSRKDNGTLQGSGDDR